MRGPAVAIVVPSPSIPLLPLGPERAAEIEGVLIVLDGWAA